jgi:hypothetical protein
MIYKTRTQSIHNFSVSLVSGSSLWFIAYGAWIMVNGFWFINMEYGVMQVYDAWFLFYGSWLMVYEIYGYGFMVHCFCQGYVIPLSTLHGLKFMPHA